MQTAPAWCRTVWRRVQPSGLKRLGACGERVGADWYGDAAEPPVGLKNDGGLYLVSNFWASARGR
jgi:hypothetical protein